jgi:hypothetical protein
MCFCSAIRFNPNQYASGGPPVLSEALEIFCERKFLNNIPDQSTGAAYRCANGTASVLPVAAFNYFPYHSAHLLFKVESDRVKQSQLLERLKNATYVIHYFSASSGGSSEIICNDDEQVLGHFAGIHCPITCSSYEILWGWKWNL